jgi:hypothetical protein
MSIKNQANLKRETDSNLEKNLGKNMATNKKSVLKSRVKPTSSPPDRNTSGEIRTTGTINKSPNRNSFESGADCNLEKSDIQL